MKTIFLILALSFLMPPCFAEEINEKQLRTNKKYSKKAKAAMIIMGATAVTIASFIGYQMYLKKRYGFDIGNPFHKWIPDTNDVDGPYNYIVTSVFILGSVIARLLHINENHFDQTLTFLHLKWLAQKCYMFGAVFRQGFCNKDIFSLLGDNRANNNQQIKRFGIIIYELWKGPDTNNFSNLMRMDLSE